MESLLDGSSVTWPRAAVIAFDALQKKQFGFVSANYDFMDITVPGAPPAGDQLEFPEVTLDHAAENDFAAGASFEKITFTGAGYSITDFGGAGARLEDASVLSSLVGFGRSNQTIL